MPSPSASAIPTPYLALVYRPPFFKSAAPNQSGRVLFKFSLPLLLDDMVYGHIPSGRFGVADPSQGPGWFIMTRYLAVPSLTKLLAHFVELNLFDPLCRQCGMQNVDKCHERCNP